MNKLPTNRQELVKYSMQNHSLLDLRNNLVFVIDTVSSFRVISEWIINNYVFVKQHLNITIKLDEGSRRIIVRQHGRPLYNMSPRHRLYQTYKDTWRTHHA